MERQHREWLAFVAQFDERIKELDGWLSERARLDERIHRLNSGFGCVPGLVLDVPPSSDASHHRGCTRSRALPGHADRDATGDRKLMRPWPHARRASTESTGTPATSTCRQRRDGTVTDTPRMRNARSAEVGL